MLFIAKVKLSKHERKDQQASVNFIAIQSYSIKNSENDNFLIGCLGLIELAVNFVSGNLFLSWYLNPSGVELVGDEEMKKKLVVWMAGGVILLQNLFAWWMFCHRNPDVKSFLGRSDDDSMSKKYEIKLVVKPPLYKNIRRDSLRLYKNKDLKFDSDKFVGDFVVNDVQ